MELHIRCLAIYARRFLRHLNHFLPGKGLLLLHVMNGFVGRYQLRQRKQENII